MNPYIQICNLHHHYNLICICFYLQFSYILLDIRFFLNNDIHLANHNNKNICISLNSLNYLDNNLNSILCIYVHNYLPSFHNFCKFYNMAQKIWLNDLKNNHLTYHSNQKNLLHLKDYILDKSYH